MSTEQTDEAHQQNGSARHGSAVEFQNGLCDLQSEELLLQQHFTCQPQPDDLSRVRTLSSCPSNSSTGTAPEELPSMVPPLDSDEATTRYDAEELRAILLGLLPADSLLPGECMRFVGSDSTGVVLVLTNYRLLLLRLPPPSLSLPDEAALLESLPACLVERLQLSDGLQLQIHCKDGHCCQTRLCFESLNDLTRWVERLDPGRLSPLLDCNGATYFPCLFKKAARKRLLQCEPRLGKQLELGYDAHYTDPSFRDEAARLGLCEAKGWRVTDLNSDRSLCPSYPRLHIVPCDVTDDELGQSSKYRAQGRFPTAVWRCRATGASLARSAQPLVGLAGFLGWRCEPDEKLVRLLSYDTDKKVLIVDARHYTAALGNGTRGGGYERPEYYSGTEIEYLGLPNIHTVRSSFAALRSALATACCGRDCTATSGTATATVAAAAAASQDVSFLSDLEKAGWLSLLAALLRHASRIAQVLVSDGRSVLVHCSDGWDRTPQLTSLCLLLADPHYRSLDGFRLLLNREWFEFGHKFADRCSGKDPNERSPIFLQFLDCVHQLLLQFPTQFEFTEALLRRLAIHSFSGLFSSFLSNSPSERDGADLKSRGLCVWNVLSLRGMKNELYRPSVPCNGYGTDGVLAPSVALHSLQLWRALYVPEQPATFDRLDWDGLPVANDPFQDHLRSLRQELASLQRQKSALEERLLTGAALASPAAAAQDDCTGRRRRSQHGDSGSSSDPSLESAELIDASDEGGVVRWVPDHLCRTCTDCRIQFGQLVRRHHCRACGEIFCYKCASHYLALPDQFLRDTCRVCNSCYRTLKPQ